MKFQVSEGEKYQQVMEVEVPVEEMELPIKLACKRLAEKVNIPGFRKGKAPRSVLESFVGMEGILDEAVNDLMPKAYVQGLEETGLEPVSQPQIEIVTLAAGEPFRFKAAVTVKPQVKLGQYKELPLTRQIIEVNEEDVDRELESQRQRMTKLVEREEGCPAEKGDTVNIDFTGYKDGQAFAGGAGEDYDLELGSGSFIPGFEDQLIGAVKGEDKEVNVTFPAEYQEASLAGQAAVFQVKVNAVKGKKVPELDQAFVEEVSETADDMDQLRAEIKEKLTKQSLDMADNNTRSSAIMAAVDNAEIDVPPIMIEQELDDMLEDMSRRLQMQGLDLDKYLEYTGTTMADLRANYQSQAEFMVKRNLTLDAILKAEDIQCGDQELEEQIQQLSAQYYQPAEKIREQLAKGGSLEELTYSIRMQKASDLIFDTAVITDEILDREKLMAEAAARAAEAAGGSEEAAEEPAGPVEEETNGEQ